MPAPLAKFATRTMAGGPAFETRDKSSPAGVVVYTAENPQKADRIAAAPRTENV